ncbi:MAG: DUF4326 domain-containing protein [Solirubrobacteraceae bacterium]
MYGAKLVTKGTRWGNPFATKNMSAADRALAVRRYEHEHLPSRPDLLEQLPDLRGHRLACYCPLDEPCHADVLARLANGPEVES